eukprot:Skav211038  [mRNA]  locus=scaffold1434:159065:161719:- [translate_table: standard]
MAPHEGGRIGRQERQQAFKAEKARGTAAIQDGEVDAGVIFSLAEIAKDSLGLRQPLSSHVNAGVTQHDFQEAIPGHNCKDSDSDAPNLEGSTLHTTPAITSPQKALVSGHPWASQPLGGQRRYRAAKEVTFVTFHDRAARHKIGEGAQAHDETTRKYVQMVKRLVTFAVPWQGLVTNDGLSNGINDVYA